MNDSPPDSESRPSAVQLSELADEFQTLVAVCRLIAGRAGDRSIGDELRDLAEGLDWQIERLRTFCRSIP
jgi:hypothetical protein